MQGGYASADPPKGGGCPMVEMLLVVFAAMNFVVALMYLIVFIMDVITRNKK